MYAELIEKENNMDIETLRQLQAEATRLRDGIKALADDMHAKGWAAHNENDPGSASAYGHAATALRALLDGEASHVD